MLRMIQAAAMTIGTIAFVAYQLVQLSMIDVATREPDALHVVAYRFGRRSHSWRYLTQDQVDLLHTLLGATVAMVALAFVISAFSPRQRAYGEI